MRRPVTCVIAAFTETGGADELMRDLKQLSALRERSNGLDGVQAPLGHVPVMAGDGALNAFRQRMLPFWRQEVQMAPKVLSAARQ